MFLSPGTQNKVQSIIKGSSSTAFDEIPQRIVKSSAEIIEKPLAHIYNLSFQTGIFQMN
jgi:hypothetical protein